MRRWHVLFEPTVPILLLASVMHAVRQSLFDLLLFAGTAALIVVDSLRAPRTGPMAGQLPADDHGRSGGISGRSWWVTGVVIVAIALGGFERDSVVMRAALVAVALMALWMVLCHPFDTASATDRPFSRHGPRTSPRGWPAWAVIGVIACLWELTSFAFLEADPTGTGPNAASRITHPELSDLVGPLLSGWLGRSVFLILWGGAGVWLLRHLVSAARRSQHDAATATSLHERTAEGVRREGVGHRRHVPGDRGRREMTRQAPGHEPGHDSGHGLVSGSGRRHGHRVESS